MRFLIILYVCFTIVPSIAAQNAVIGSNTLASTSEINSILSITPLGNIGINKKMSAENLDENENINLTETLKINGASQVSGQALRMNSTGQNEWIDLEDYKYNRMITSTYVSTVQVPAGITRMVIEQWGGGGGGGAIGGGGSGCYARLTFDVSLIESFTIANGAGGAGESNAEAVNGTSSTLTVNQKNGTTTKYIIYGGLGAKNNSIGQPRTPTIYPTGPQLLSYVALPGKRGKIVQYSNNYQYMADGGDAITGLAEGGSGSYVYYDYNNPSRGQILSLSGSGIFSSGGGGGWNNFPITIKGAPGGNGVTILRW